MLEYDLILRDNIRLEGRPADAEECYLLQKVEGLDSRDVRDQVDALPGRDGDVFGPQFEAGIRLIVEGLILSRTAGGLRAKERGLRKALRGGSALWPVLLSGRFGDPGVLTTDVRLLGPLRCVDSVDGPRRLKAFTFAIASQDPHWEPFAAALSAAIAASTPGGLAWPIVWPIDWGVAVSPGTIVTNSGDAPVYPVLTVTGPCVNYQLENVTTGESIYLSTVLNAGQSLVVDTRDRTVVVDGVTNRYRDVNRVDTTWWRLEPGANEIRFRPATFAAPSQLSVSWRDGYR